MSIQVKSSDTNVLVGLATWVNRHLRRTGASTVLAWHTCDPTNGGGWENSLSVGGANIGRQGGGWNYFSGAGGGATSISTQFGGDLGSYRFRSARWNKDADSGQVDLFWETTEVSYSTHATSTSLPAESNGDITYSTANSTPMILQHAHVYNRRLEDWELGRLAQYPASIQEGLIFYAPLIPGFLDTAFMLDRGKIIGGGRFNQASGTRWIDARRSAKSGTFTASAGDFNLKLFQRNRRLHNYVSAGSGTTVSVPAGSLTLTAYAPTVLAPRTIAVPSASLTLTGNAPAITNNVSVAVPAGSLALTANAPSVLAPRLVGVPAGSLALTAYAPTILNPQALFVPAGALYLNAYAPVVTDGTTPAAGLSNMLTLGVG